MLILRACAFQVAAALCIELKHVLPIFMNIVYDIALVMWHGITWLVATPDNEYAMALNILMLMWV